MNIETYVRTLDLIETLLLSRLDSFPKDNIPQHFSLPLPQLEVELIDFLAVCNVNDSIYFKSISDESETLTFGCNKKISAKLSELQQHFESIELINNDPLSRFYSILSFQKHDAKKDQIWSSLNESIFIQPFIEINKKKNKESIMYVHYSSQQSHFLDYVKEFFISLKDMIRISEPKNYTSFNFSQFPNKEIWNRNLNEAIDHMKKGSIQKVVLSRKSVATFKENINGSKILKRFLSKEQNCSVFYYQQNKTSIFFSITPEKLYLRQKNYIEVDAIAGTRSISDNGFYSGELLSSTKDHFEHELVVQGIINNLQHISNSLKIKYKHQLVKLSKVQHLKTLITAQLLNDSDDFKIISSLQPTAAIGGTPRKKAQKFITNTEQFNRGFYTGVGGLMTKDYTEFLVLIRSCLIQRNKIYFFVGAGIVEESDPNDEWDELNSKLANYMESLNEFCNI